MNPALNNLRQWAGGQGAMLQGISAPLLVVAILALMVLPIPAWLLDTFFTLNIAIALMVMMVAAYMVRPLDFAAFPAVLLAIAIMAALGPKIENVIISISVVYIPTVARTVRSAALVVREQTYIEAIRALGGKPWRIIWRHIAPNCMSPLIVQATFIFAYAVIIEASLSFLGAGTPPPQPSWGNILSDGRTLIRQAWWIMVFPGIAIVMTVLGLNLIGDGLRDLLDPHTNKAKS